MTWSKEPLECLIDTLESGSRPTGGASTDSGQIFSIGGENILQSGGITLETVKRVPVAFFKLMTKGHLRIDDVLVNKDGAQTGKVGWYQPGCELAACINEHVFLLRVDPDRVTQGYLYYSLLSDAGQAQIRLQISGSAQPGLRAGFTKGIIVEFPTDIREQSMIVRVLSAVDRAIEQTEALIAKQQRIKTGLMQDLLTRGIDKHGNLRSEQTHEFKDSPLGRIPVEWDLATVDQIASITTGDKDTQNADPGAEYPFFVRSQTIEKISSYSFDGEAVLTAGDGVGTGKVFHYFNGRFDFHQRVYCIHSFADDMLGYFFFCYFQTHFMARVAQFSAKGSVDSVRRHMITKMLLPKPGRNEQAHVVNILRTSTKKIDDHTASLRKLRHLKAGVMKDLLTGDRQVTALLESAKQAAGA